MPIDGHAGVIFQHDNARRPHIPQITRTFLHWPARSSDLNPIEHVWDKMGRRLRRFPHKQTVWRSSVVTYSKLVMRYLKTDRSSYSGHAPVSW
jgi:hypothetical protein